MNISKKLISGALCLSLLIGMNNIAFAEPDFNAKAHFLTTPGLINEPASGYTQTYNIKAVTRYDAVMLILKIRNLEKEALTFKGSGNFKDASKYSNMKPILAYIKAHPELGFISDMDGEFHPKSKIKPYDYTRALLSILGYTYDKDYKASELFVFAKSKGITVLGKNSISNSNMINMLYDTLNATTKDGHKIINDIYARLGSDFANQYRGDKFNRAKYNLNGPETDKTISKYSFPGYKIYTQPAVDKEGNAFFGAYTIDLKTYAGTSSIICIDSSMKLKWKKDFKSYLFTSPTINKTGDTVYIGVPAEDPESDGGVFVALNAETGEQKWEVDPGAVTSSPAIDEEGNIIIGNAAEKPALVKISPEGKILWKYDLRDGVSAKPLIDMQGRIYLSNHDKYVYCIDKDGKLIWEKNLGVDMSASSALDEYGNIYVGGYTQNGMSKYFKLNHSGQILWQKDLGISALPSSCAIDIDNDKIYFLTSTVTKTPEAPASYVWAIDYDGNEIWKHKVENHSLQASPCVDKNGNVYIGYEKTYEKTKKGIMAAFDKDGNLLFEYETEGDVMSPATLQDGSLYFGDYVGNLYKISK